MNIVNKGKIMKLFLCGGGCGKQIVDAMHKFEGMIDESKPILYIPLAMNENRYDGCAEWFAGEIKNINFGKFEMVRSSLELSQKNFDDYSALFIGGGNTFKLLSDINQNGNREKILDYLKNGGIVFGGSAGAIIFGKDINTCLYDDGNKVGLKNTSGLNLLNGFSILCHLSPKSLSKNMKQLKAFSQKNKVIYLPEESVIFVNGKRPSLIGNSKYVVFNRGKYFVHGPANFKKDIKM